MADSLNLIAEQFSIRCPETIQLSAGTNIHTPVINIMETIRSISYHLFLKSVIPSTCYLLRIHTVRKVERRCHIDIIKQGEVCLYRDCMLESILPILNKVRT